MVFLCKSLDTQAIVDAYGVKRGVSENIECTKRLRNNNLYVVFDS